MRLLMISNQPTLDGYAGFQAAFEEMAGTGELDSFTYLAPAVTSAAEGLQAARAEVMRAGEELRPEVVLVATPKALGHDAAWIGRFLSSSGDPLVLYYEADSWGGPAKPITPSMAAWLAAADTIFTVAREPHREIFRRHGGGDVRYIPHTYCQVLFGEAEERAPSLGTPPDYDAVVVGSRLARWGRVSRLPGAVQRARLVRRLQRQSDLRLAIYGIGWSGRGAQGVLPFGRQVAAIREGRASVNWDHYPAHEAYASDRLPISMLAGRAHITTAHPGLEWLPGPDEGLFLEPSVDAVVRRTRELAASPEGDVLAAGERARQWVRGRLSHRQAARFMLGAVDRGLLDGLPQNPWLDLVPEWPS